MAVSRTMGPMHFEDLEPKRFEDLVRQLIYDFKQWRRLEATGRSGSDDGFDARGFEIVNLSPHTEGDPELDEIDSGVLDNLWLVQCKREQRITPAKLEGYLRDTKLAESERLHGLIFAAACDFSKKARDVFRAKCLELGIEEYHLWGKAELEDMLFQPRNDHLLFAYFGVSLTVRRRSQTAKVRARLATKRKMFKFLEKDLNRTVLLRSPEAVDYPRADDITNFLKWPLWMPAEFCEFYHSGLVFQVGRYYAYFSDDGNTWDAALACNVSPIDEDVWKTALELSGSNHHEEEIRKWWYELPKHNRGWLEIYYGVPYDDVVDIDDLGDEFYDCLHLYVHFDKTYGPFSARTALLQMMDCDGREKKPKNWSELLESRIAFVPNPWRIHHSSVPYLRIA